MTGKSGSFSTRLALVGGLAVVAFLIIISLRESDTSKSGTTPGPSTTTSAGTAIPDSENTGRAGSVEIPESPGSAAGQGGQAGSSTSGESVNPTIDRYGVPVSVSLPIVPDAGRDAQADLARTPQNGSVDRRTVRAPEAGVSQNPGDSLQGPGASSTGSAGLPPEGLNPQMSGQAPEAFDPGLPMLPPEATDAGISGPGPGELEGAVTGPGPGEQPDSTPTTGPDGQ